jgi:hypothetical protein
VQFHELSDVPAACVPLLYNITPLHEMVARENMDVAEFPARVDRDFELAPPEGASRSQRGLGKQALR